MYRTLRAHGQCPLHWAKTRGWADIQSISVAVRRERAPRKVTHAIFIPYSLDQTPLSISRRSRIVAAPPEVLNEIVAALE